MEPGPFAVLGRIDVDPATFDEAQLEHMVAVLRGTPGFVGGTWARDVEGPGALHSLVRLATEEHARDFAAGARSALAGASLTVLQVLADA